MKVLVNLILILLGTLTSVALAEFGFSLLNAQALKVPLVSASGAPVDSDIREYSRYHPILGYDGVPNAHYPGLTYLATHNAHGYRGPLVPEKKKDGVQRVLVMGDSQAWGFGVHDRHTIASQLQMLLNEHAGAGKFEVLNFGVSGYGPGQSYLKYLIQGIDYAPDVVVFVYFHENDRYEAETLQYWGVYKPKFMVPDERFCLVNVPVKRVEGWGRSSLSDVLEQQMRRAHGGVALGRLWLSLSSSQTYQFFRRRKLTQSFAAPDSNMESWLQAFLPRDPLSRALLERYLSCEGLGELVELPTTGAANKTLNRILEHFHRAVKVRGAQFVMVSIPHRDDYWNRVDKTDYEYSLSAFQDWRLPVFDLKRIGYRSNLSGKQMFPFDSHLSAVGSKLVALVLRDAIVNKGTKHNYERELRFQRYRLVGKVDRSKSYIRARSQLGPITLR